MKLGRCVFVIVVAALAYAVLKRPSADAPVKAMEKLVRAFPTEVHRPREKVANEIVDLTYNVEKTQSLSAPIVGSIRFAFPFLLSEVRYEMIYHWHDERWVFQRLECLSTHVAQDAFRLSILSAPEMDSFIRFGKVVVVEQEIAAVKTDAGQVAAATPAPRATIIPAKPITPSPAEQAAEIARRYQPK